MQLLLPLLLLPPPPLPASIMPPLRLQALPAQCQHLHVMAQPPATAPRQRPTAPAPAPRPRATAPQMLQSSTNGGVVFVRCELDTALFDRIAMNPSFM